VVLFFFFFCCLGGLRADDSFKFPFFRHFNCPDPSLLGSVSHAAPFSGRVFPGNFASQVNWHALVALYFLFPFRDPHVRNRLLFPSSFSQRPPPFTSLSFVLNSRNTSICARETTSFSAPFPFSLKMRRGKALFVLSIHPLFFAGRWSGVINGLEFFALGPFFIQSLPSQDLISSALPAPVFLLQRPLHH